jgi:hypothetical protein
VQDQTEPITTTTTTATTAPSPSSTLAASAQGELAGSQPSSSDYSLYVKVGVPVLSIVMLILSLSGCIVAASSCVLVQNDKKRYRYRRLIYTDA